MELTTPDLSWSLSHFEAGGGCCLAIAGQVESQCPGLPQAKQLPILGRRTVNETGTRDWMTWGCCWKLADEVAGGDGRTSEDLLLAAKELLLFFLRVDKLARARRSALKIRLSSSESSARSCFLYSSTVYQREGCVFGCVFGVRAVTSHLHLIQIWLFQAANSAQRTWRWRVSLLISD